MAIIHLIEPGPTGGPGAMGAKILCTRLIAAGHTVTHVRLLRDDQPIQGTLFHEAEQEVDASSLPVPDAWFVSTIYTRQWVYLRDMFERLGIPLWTRDRSPSDPLVAFGGQTSYAPEPIAEFADIVALGDGELTGLHLGELLDQGLRREDIMAACDGHRGYYVPSAYPDSRRPLFQRWETPALDPTLVFPGPRDSGRATLEVARGCKSKCAFCPIGWAGGTYREAPLSSMQSRIEEMTSRRINQVNLFAPDFSSVTYVDDLERYVESVGCRNSGHDARIDRAKHHMDAGGKVKEFAFGIEGMSERLRRAIGKPLRHSTIVDAMKHLDNVITQWYLIVGLPGETQDDMDEFMGLLREVMAHHKTRLNITLTPLQAVPHTPLEREDMRYNEVAIARALALRDWARERWERDQWMILCSGVKGRDLHEHDALMQRGGRELAQYLARARASDSYVSSGRWRRDIGYAGVDPDDSLAALPVAAPTPWDFVDVGMPRAKLRAARQNYDRQLSRETDTIAQ